MHVSGEPAPEKKWLINGEEVETSDRLKITYADYTTRFTVRKAARCDTGTLVLTAENVNGRDRAEVQITVLDVPGKPMGPLVVKNMTAKDCVLEWKPPKDNGGLPINYYIIGKSNFWFKISPLDGNLIN